MTATPPTETRVVVKLRFVPVGSNPEPVMVTDVPPLMDPWFGATLVMVGTGAYA